jgi:hypothetical protein
MRRGLEDLNERCRAPMRREREHQAKWGEPGGGFAFSFARAVLGERRSAGERVPGLTEQPRSPKLACASLEIGEQRASFFESRSQPLDPVQLCCDLLKRAVRILRELVEATLAAGHVRAQRPYETVRLLDQPAQLGFGHRLVGNDFPQPFE